MTRLLALVGALALAAGLAPAGAVAAPGQERDDVIDGRYVVVLDAGDPEKVADEHARDHGARVRHVYRQALRGYSATMSDEAAGRVNRDGRVAYVEADRVVTTAHHECGHSGGPPGSGDGDCPDTDPDGGSGQVTPWGVGRTGADAVTGSGAGVHAYVIDSGIDADHPDLVGNLGEGHAVEPCFKPGATCDAEWDDDYDHGTHVAGTIGAVDNDVDVVGVAPEVTLHAVKVLDRRGRSSTSEVIAGIDWVAGHNPGQARVANISLGRTGSKDDTCTGDGFTGSDSFHEALCSATSTGVVFAVAAGNSGADAAGTVPAAYDDTVLTASATECALIGEDHQTCDADSDDWASFSNWGDDPADWTDHDSAPVVIGAPGVDVLSTWPDDELHEGSGTSMAAPHVAGGSALYLAGQLQAANRSAFTNTRQALLGSAEDSDPDTTSWSNTSGNPHDEWFLDVNALLGGS